MGQSPPDLRPVSTDSDSMASLRLLALAATLALASAQSFTCPEKDGYFEDTRQCDKYYDCYDGIPEERLCPDGLVFDPFSRKREPCDHYFNVDCGDRLVYNELTKQCDAPENVPECKDYYAFLDEDVDDAKSRK